MGTVLAIDGGRSGCRAVVIGDGGRRGPAARGRGLPALTGPEGIAGLVQAVGEAVSFCQVNPETVDAVSAGLAGMLGDADGAPAVAGGLSRLLGVERIVVTGDVVTAYAGALGARSGVVVTAGTGAVALAVAAEGSSDAEAPARPGAWHSATARADGWGHVLGDTGSGYWIGRRGLEQALKAFDGRGGSPALAGLAECHIGPLDSLPQRIDASGNPTAAVAAFARHVADAARRGDGISASIWAEAARELATSAAACAQRVFAATDRVPVSWAGGLFTAADLLLAPFLQCLTELFPGAVPTPPAGDALDGAALLAGAGGPGVLAPFVHDSGAGPSEGSPSGVFTGALT